jgi:hypothetical protein
MKYNLQSIARTVCNFTGLSRMQVGPSVILTASERIGQTERNFINLSRVQVRRSIILPASQSEGWMGVILRPSQAETGA